VTELVAVFGASPGIGKSTLVRQLAESVPPGSRVDQFDEEDVLSRPEFADVARQFRATGNVDIDTLLDGSARFVVTALDYDVKVATYKIIPPVEGMTATVEYLRHERDVTLRTMTDAGYRVVVLADAHRRAPDELAVEARERIAGVGSDSYM